MHYSVKIKAVSLCLERVDEDIDCTLVASEDLDIADLRIGQQVGLDEAVGDLANVGEGQ